MMQALGKAVAALFVVIGYGLLVAYLGGVALVAIYIGLMAIGITPSFLNLSIVSVIAGAVLILGMPEPVSKVLSRVLEGTQVLAVWALIAAFGIGGALLFGAIFPTTHISNTEGLLLIVILLLAGILHHVSKRR